MTYRLKGGASPGVMVGIVLLAVVVMWQVYLGASIKKVGIPGVFEIELEGAKAKLCMNEDVGFDRNGTKGQRDEDTHAFTAAECESICLNDGGCQSVSYRLSSNQCWIKDSVPLRQPDADFVSAVKSACP